MDFQATHEPTSKERNLVVWFVSMLLLGVAVGCSPQAQPETLVIAPEQDVDAETLEDALARVDAAVDHVNGTSTPRTTSANIQAAMRRLRPSAPERTAITIDTHPEPVFVDPRGLAPSGVALMEVVAELPTHGLSAERLAASETISGAEALAPLTIPSFRRERIAKALAADGSRPRPDVLAGLLLTPHHDFSCPTLIHDVQVRERSQQSFAEQLAKSEIELRSTAMDYVDALNHTTTFAEISTRLRATPKDRARKQLEGLAPRTREYRVLRRLLALYLDHTTDGLVAFPAGEKWPSEGDTGPGAQALGQRLHQEGLLDHRDSYTMDNTMEDALRRMASRCGLPDLKNKAQLKACLAVPVERRVEQLGKTLETWRSLRLNNTGNYLLLNTHTGDGEVVVAGLRTLSFEMHGKRPLGGRERSTIKRVSVRQGQLELEVSAAKQGSQTRRLRTDKPRRIGQLLASMTGAHLDPQAPAFDQTLSPHVPVYAASLIASVTPSGAVVFHDR